MILGFVHNGVLATNCYTLDPISTFWILNVTDHYNLWDLGELLRQVVRFLQPNVAFRELKPIYSRRSGETFTLALNRCSVRVLLCTAPTHR